MVGKLRKSKRIRAQEAKKKPEPPVLLKKRYAPRESQTWEPPISLAKLPFRLWEDKLGWHMECLFDESKKKWINKYSVPYSRECATHKQWFDTSAKAYASFQKAMNKAESLCHVVLELEPDATFTPSFEKIKWEPKSELDLIYRGPDNCTIDVYSKILSQVDKRAIRLCVGLDSVDDKMTSCMLNEKLFKLEWNNRFWLHRFHGILTDAQLLGLDGYGFHLKNASAITPAGFVEFIQKLLNSQRVTTHSLCNTSLKLSNYLFGDKYFNGKRFRSSDVRLTLSNRHNERINWQLCFTENEIRTFDLSLNVLCRNDGVENTETLEQYPSLKRFLSDLSKGIPRHRRYIKFQ